MSFKRFQIMSFAVNHMRMFVLHSLHCHTSVNKPRGTVIMFIALLIQNLFNALQCFKMNEAKKKNRSKPKTNFIDCSLQFYRSFSSWLTQFNHWFVQRAYFIFTLDVWIRALTVANDLHQQNSVYEHKHEESNATFVSNIICFQTKFFPCLFSSYFWTISYCKCVQTPHFHELTHTSWNNNTT